MCLGSNSCSGVLLCRAELRIAAFQMIADGQRLEHVLRVVTGLGLRNLTGKTVNKQTFSKMMRNKGYTGEITSGGITCAWKLRASNPRRHFPASTGRADQPRSQERAQSKDGCIPARWVCYVPFVQEQADGCRVRGRNGSKMSYYFCWQKGCRDVSVRKEISERDWVVLLNMMQPDNSYWKQLGIARPRVGIWKQRKRSDSRKSVRHRTRSTCAPLPQNQR